MRVSLLLGALLLGAALNAAVVAENGLTVLGDKGSDAIRGGPPPQCRHQLRFHLDQPTRVWVEAQGLQGLHADSNAAPEVFLDERYLGPLRVEHGRDWRSPLDLDLPAGPHVLELRCAAVADADDVSMQRLRVLSAAAPKKRKAKAPAKQAGCAAPLLRKDWPPALGRGSLTLSVLSGREAASPVLATLKDGEAWLLQARVPAAAQGGALALNATLSRLAPGRWRLLFMLDSKGRVDRNDPVGYRPGAWEPLRFQFCQGQLRADFAQAGALQMAEDAPSVSIEVAARDLELGLKPAP